MKTLSTPDTTSILEARSVINDKLIKWLNFGLIASLGVTLLLTFLGGYKSCGLLFIGLGSFYCGILVGFLYSTFGAEESRFSPLATTVTSLFTGALALDLTKLHDSLVYRLLQVMAHASGLAPEQALGLVVMVSITLGTIGFLTMYFNRRLVLNIEMNVMSQLMDSLSQSRQQVQKGEVDPSPESDKISPEALKAAHEIVKNPWAGKSNHPSELVADAKAFYAVNDFDKAREVAAKALTFRPNDPEAKLFEASSILGNDEDMNEKRAAEALTILEQFQPESAPLMVNKLMGYCYLYISDPLSEDGKAKLKRSVELTQSYLTAQMAKGLPRDMGAVLNLACAYAQLNDETNLIPLLRELIATDPSINKRLRSLPDFTTWVNNPAFNEVVPK